MIFFPFPPWVCLGGWLFVANMLNVYGHGHGDMGRSGTGWGVLFYFTFSFSFACWRKILGNGRTISCMWAEFEIYKRRSGRSYQIRYGRKGGTRKKRKTITKRIIEAT